MPKQDMMGWVAQGAISDRTREHLTASDKGVILYHKLLNENMDKVARGEDPDGRSSAIRPRTSRRSRFVASITGCARSRTATATISSTFAAWPTSAADVSVRAASRAVMLRWTAALAALPLRAGAQARPVIRVGVESGAETFSEPLYGVDAGIFARAGLDVQPSVFPAAGPIAAALAGGALDLGATDVILLANAVNRGVPLIAVAASGLFRTQEPTSGVCVPRGSAVRSAKALEGTSIAVGTLVSLTSVAIRMWLTRNGADPAKVQFVEMKFAEMPAALARGNVAAAYITEPLLTRHADDLTLIATPYGTIAETFPISVIVASRSWLGQNADAAKRFAAALYETARWANAHRKETAPMLASFTKLEPELIARMHRTQFATALEPAMLQPILDAAAAYKLIERPTKAADLIAPLG